MVGPTITMEDEMWAAIGANADISKAAFVRQACREKLDRVDPQWESREREALADG
jgi:hypothetical protein